MSSNPRDFLTQASNTLNTPRPLAEMLKEDRSYVTNKLVDLLQSGGIYERKYAAFALGQIGEESTLSALKNRRDRETVDGVLEAISAAIVAIEMASVQKGGSEIQRRQIIEDVYNGRSPLASSEPNVNRTSQSSSTGGGCSSVITFVLLALLLIFKISV